MKKIVLILVGCFCFVTTTAFAGPYFSASVGAFMPTDSDVTDPSFASDGISSVELSYDTGYALTLAIGQDLDTVRVEGEFSYKAADMNEGSVTLTNGASVSAPIDGDVSSLSLMANVWKDIKLGGVTPYIGLGVGLAKVDGDIEGDSESDTVFAYQLGLGIGVPITENLAFDISYRYFATSDPDFDGTELDLASSNVMAGLRVNF